MRCFTHQDKEAIGTCSACSKGICAECAADLGHSIACKSSCEEKAHLVNSLIQRNAITIKASKRNRNIQPAFFAVMGLGFVYYGLQGHPKFNFTSMLGIGFLIFAGIYYFVIQKWARELDKKAEEDAFP